MTEIYVSTDVEADGPIPGPHSMLSFGSAAFLADGTLLDTYAVNLATLPGVDAMLVFHFDAGTLLERDGSTTIPPWSR